MNVAPDGEAANHGLVADALDSQRDFTSELGADARRPGRRIVCIDRPKRLLGQRLLILDGRAPTLDRRELSVHPGHRRQHRAQRAKDERPERDSEEAEPALRIGPVVRLALGDDGRSREGEARGLERAPHQPGVPTRGEDDDQHRVGAGVDAVHPEVDRHRRELKHTLGVCDRRVELRVDSGRTPETQPAADDQGEPEPRDAEWSTERDDGDRKDTPNPDERERHHPCWSRRAAHVFHERVHWRTDPPSAGNVRSDLGRHVAVKNQGVATDCSPAKTSNNSARVKARRVSVVKPLIGADTVSAP